MSNYNWYWMEYEKGLAFTRKFTQLTIAGVTRLTAAEKSGLIIGLVSQKYWWKWPSGLSISIKRNINENEIFQVRPQARAIFLKNSKLIPSTSASCSEGHWVMIPCNVIQQLH